MMEHVVERDDALIAVTVAGDGPSILLLASVGRSATDFDEVAASLRIGGYRTLAMDLRGIGISTGPLEDLTLHDLTADAAAVIEELGSPPAHVVGHAFGQRVARCLAADHPDLVRSLTIIAAGGAIQPDPEIFVALANCFDASLPADEHIENVRRAFFAPGNDPWVWKDGWWPEAARAHGMAGQSTPREEWWLGGSAPILVIQGLQDAIAPPENGRMLQRGDPNRIRLIELDHAGHALLPEQPELIAEHVLAFLREF